MIRHLKRVASASDFRDAAFVIKPVDPRSNDHGVIPMVAELDIVTRSVVGQIEIVGGGGPLRSHCVDPLDPRGDP